MLVEYVQTDIAAAVTYLTTQLKAMGYNLPPHVAFDTVDYIFSKATVDSRCIEVNPLLEYTVGFNWDMPTIHYIMKGLECYIENIAEELHLMVSQLEASFPSHVFFLEEMVAVKRTGRRYAIHAITLSGNSDDTELRSYSHIKMEQPT